VVSESLFYLDLVASSGYMTELTAEQDREDHALMHEAATSTAPAVVEARSWSRLPAVNKLCGGLSGTELVKVSWLSSILLFLMMAYWLLCSLKDPIMSAISGVRAVFILSVVNCPHPLLYVCTRWSSSLWRSSHH
jgi:hypothetical protein